MEFQLYEREKDDDVNKQTRNVVLALAFRRWSCTKICK